MPGRRRERGRRYRLARLSPAAKASLQAIKAENNTAFQVVTRFIDNLRDDPTVGTDLRGPFDGWRSAHVYGDRYRVIWRFDYYPPVVEVLRAGRRKTVYDDPPPDEAQA